MEERLLFEVENVINIKGQWLKDGDIFEVYQTTRKNSLELRLNRRKDNKKFRPSDHCYLGFSYEGDLEDKDGILKAIMCKYSSNTFRIVNSLEIELI